VSYDARGERKVEKGREIRGEDFGGREWKWGEGGAERERKWGEKMEVCTLRKGGSLLRQFEVAERD